MQKENTIDRMIDLQKIEVSYINTKIEELDLLWKSVLIIRISAMKIQSLHVIVRMFNSPWMYQNPEAVRAIQNQVLSTVMAMLRY